MPESGQICSRRFRLNVFALASALAIAVPPAAHAQNLFEALANALSGRSTTPATASPDAGDPNPWNLPERAAEQSVPRTSYCVRTCDGRFFALPRSAGGAHMNAAQICSAMCPAAETAVYSGGAIERAVNDKGKSYSSLKTAFLFRDKAVGGCSCTSSGAGGVAALDVKDDPTLRRGDIVVTRDGPRIYTGARGSDRDSAFVKPDEFKGLPQSVRHELTRMQIAPEPNETATLPAGAKPASLPVAAVQPAADSPRGHVTASPTHVSPVADAFNSFVR